MSPQSTAEVWVNQVDHRSAVAGHLPERLREGRVEGADHGQLTGNGVVEAGDDRGRRDAARSRRGRRTRLVRVGVARREVETRERRAGTTHAWLAAAGHVATIDPLSPLSAKYRHVVETVDPVAPGVASSRSRPGVDTTVVSGRSLLKVKV